MYYSFHQDFYEKAVVLSQGYDENCLPKLRAHLLDLKEGVASLPDVKLMVLGNGRVGKTQICRRLRGADYNPAIPSTHGITISTAVLSDGYEAECLGFLGAGYLPRHPCAVSAHPRRISDCLVHGIREFRGA